MTEYNIAEILSDMKYEKGNNGIFQIMLSVNDIDIEWKKILNDKEPPFCTFKHYLHEHKYQFHQEWADKLAEKVIAENNSEKDFSEMVLRMSEISIVPEKLLKEEIMVNIGVDTGDSDYDYTANTVPPAYGADITLKQSEKSASIVWLTKQQGHKKGELYFALNHIRHNRELIHTELMKSIANEVWCTLSFITHLFFFVRMSVYDLLLLNSLLHWHHKTKKWGGYILLNKETSTGFYSPFVGTGSAVGIKLEKEVKLPVKFISEILPDSAYEYPMSEIVLTTSLWDKGRVTYMSLPKHFRMSMNEYGFPPLKKNIRQDVDKI